jgi:hypothetical protein
VQTTTKKHPTTFFWTFFWTLLTAEVNDCVTDVVASDTASAAVLYADVTDVAKLFVVGISGIAGIGTFSPEKSPTIAKRRNKIIVIIITAGA